MVEHLPKLLRGTPAVDLRGAEDAPVTTPSVDPAADVLAAMERLERYHESLPPRDERIANHIAAMLAEAGVRSGRMLEIGARANPQGERFPSFEYSVLDLTETGPGVVLGDITSCPEIPDASYDVVLSKDVFEHIREPWKAAKEIGRILRPGGVTYHSTLFSWRYHPCPVDYWRFTPDALRFLFEDLECLHADFDPVERRRNLIGRDGNRITPDAFGGWRENWRVFYVGRRPVDSD